MGKVGDTHKYHLASRIPQFGTSLWPADVITLVVSATVISSLVLYPYQRPIEY